MNFVNCSRIFIRVFFSSGSVHVWFECTTRRWLSAACWSQMLSTWAIQLIRSMTIVLLKCRFLLAINKYFKDWNFLLLPEQITSGQRPLHSGHADPAREPRVFSNIMACITANGYYLALLCCLRRPIQSNGYLAIETWFATLVGSAWLELYTVGHAKDCSQFGMSDALAVEWPRTL